MSKHSNNLKGVKNMATEEKLLSTTEAREEIERGLKTFRAFENLTASLKNLESLEQNLKETTERVRVIREAEDGLKKAREDADASIKEAISKSAQIRRNAEKDAENTASDAKVNASKVVSDAKEEARKIKADAQSELDGLLQKSANLKDAHTVLDRSLADKNKELEVVSHTLQQHRDSISKFINGAS